MHGQIMSDCPEGHSSLGSRELLFALQFNDELTSVVWCMPDLESSEATHVLSHSQRKDPYCSSKSRFRNSKIREVASSACGQATRQAGAKGLIEVSGLNRPVVPVARQPDTRLFF